MLRPYKKTVTELCGGTPPLGGTDSGSEAFECYWMDRTEKPGIVRKPQRFSAATKVPAAFSRAERQQTRAL